jgi:uracil DNA glycosylase
MTGIGARGAVAYHARRSRPFWKALRMLKRFENAAKTIFPPFTHHFRPFIATSLDAIRPTIQGSDHFRGAARPLKMVKMVCQQAY